jgi:hypothetical protein
MAQFKVNIQKFDMKGFYDSIKNFVQTEINNELDITAYICVVNEKGITPDVAESDPSRDVLDEIFNQGKTIFFPFSGPGCGLPVPCANGKSYYDDFEDEDKENVDEDDCCLGESDVVGFTVHVDDGNLIFNSCSHYGGSCMMPASVCEEKGDLGLFGPAMEEYLHRFIK